MKTRTVILWILILITIDQLIKIIIITYFGDYQFEIIPSFIEFKPTFNEKYSYVNTLLNKHFGINVGLLPHLFLYLFLGILISAYLFYFRKNVKSNTKLLDTAIIFLVAIASCALIGNLLWKKGILDYIYLKPLFVFDLKDTYGDVFIILFILYAIKNKTELKPIKTRDVFLFAKNRLKNDK